MSLSQPSPELEDYTKNADLPVNVPEDLPFNAIWDRERTEDEDTTDDAAEPPWIEKVHLLSLFLQVVRSQEIKVSAFS